MDAVTIAPGINRRLFKRSPKMTATMCRIAVALRGQGYPQHEVGAYLGVSQSTISKTLKKLRLQAHGFPTLPGFDFSR
ncbi:hypothetical protein [Roseixanthobacter pseudopolyaromaticivorans]|uniref:hypothetical protein n=1 Tax=Xanthobacteraceae TaxID=335928 RepID=UPI003728961A